MISEARYSGPDVDSVRYQDATAVTQKWTVEQQVELRALCAKAGRPFPNRDLTVAEASAYKRALHVRFGRRRP